MTIVKNEFQIPMKFYYVTSIFDQHIFDNETTVFLFFLDLPRNVFCFIIFSKCKKYCNFYFDDAFKIYCCALC